jgi:hypothetical protein
MDSDLVQYLMSDEMLLDLRTDPDEIMQSVCLHKHKESYAYCECCGTHYSCKLCGADEV